MKVKITEPRDPINGYELWFYQDEFGGKLSVAKPLVIELKTAEEGMTSDGPTLIVREGFIKSFVEEAEKLDIKSEAREKESTRFHGVLEATRRHLDDMRLLVLKKIKK